MKISTFAPSMLAAICGLAAFGCCPLPRHEHLLVQLSTQFASSSAPAEVRSTDTYRAERENIRVVTLRLPESCLSQTAAQVTGNVASTNVILRSECAVWLAELERSLSGAGYRIISWDALLRLERTRNLSTYAAAQELGADAVFIVNSLETGLHRAGGSAGARLDYFESNEWGEPLHRAALPTNQRAVLRELTTARVGTFTAPRVAGVSATLDVTSIIARTGESVWFYRRDVTRAFETRRSLGVLFMGRDLQWRPVAPRLAQPVESTRIEEPSSRDEFRDETSPQAEDPHQQERHQLVRMVVGDCVAAFRGRSST